MICEFNHISIGQYKNYQADKENNVYYKSKNFDKCRTLENIEKPKESQKSMKNCVICLKSPSLWKSVEKLEKLHESSLIA